MASAPKTVVQPAALFLVTTVACAALAIIVAYAVYRVSENSVFLSTQRSEVRISDLLGTLITISGITVPISIGYLALKAKDLEIALADRAIHHLRELGNTVEQVRYAFLYLSDTSTKGEPSDALGALSECLGMRELDPDGERPFSKRAADWVFGEEEQSIYERYFQHSTDRSIVVRYSWLVGISGITCFVIMYFRFFGAGGQIFDGLETFVIVFTFAMNVGTYWFLLKVIGCKDRIRRRGGHQIKLACKQARPEIVATLKESENVGAELSKELKRAFTAAQNAG